MSDGAELARMAQALRDSGRYEVLERLMPRSRYAPDDGAAKRTALFVDVETTGLEASRDAIIQFCGVPFEYGEGDGRIYAVGEALSFFEDPGRPIPAEIVAVTGITDEMVRGQHIDDAAVQRQLGGASLVLAHNAGFDRPFLERRLPVFADKPWACSQYEVPWREFGYDSRSLAFLVYKHCAASYEAHRADADCYAGIHLLATPFSTGQLPFSLLLASARRGAVRLWAVDSPIEVKNTLKARGYRWNNGDDRRPRSWYLDMPKERVEEECRWLEENGYPSRKPAYRMQTLDAKVRYSTRV